MELTQTKIFTYVGFAKRSKKLLLGVNTVLLAKKNVKLLLLCGGASENTVKEAESFANKFNCPIVVSEKEPLEKLVLKENCKLAAVCDDSLAKAVLANITDGFYVLSGGIKK